MTMIKSTSVLLVLFLVFLTNAIFGEIKFEIVYTDELGEGFHIRPEARKAVEEAVGEVFSWLDHDGNVRIEVKSIIDPDRGVLAEAGSTHIRNAIIPGIYHTHLARKILFNEYDKDWDYDATITVNFASEDYIYEDEVSSVNYDFKAIIVHELTHALGFTSFIDKDEEDEDDFERACQEVMYLYYQGFEAEIKNNVCRETVDKVIGSGISVDWMLLNHNKESETFTYFDTFLVDNDGNKVVDTASLKFLRKDLFKLEDGDPGKTLYFPFEKEGELYLYPLNGMDAAHLALGAGALMESEYSKGLLCRQWSDIERKIMEALGYKLKPVKKLGLEVN